MMSTLYVSVAHRMCVCVESRLRGFQPFHNRAVVHVGGQGSETKGWAIGSFSVTGFELTRSGTLLVYRPGSW